MPIIKGTRSVTGPPAPVSSSRREYPSPDGKWTLTYHTPREFHMGATGWQMKLRHRGHMFPSPHRDLWKLAGEEGFRCEDDLQPWSHDSRALVVLTWHNGPVH